MIPSGPRSGYDEATGPPIVSRQGFHRPGKGFPHGELRRRNVDRGMPEIMPVCNRHERIVAQRDWAKALAGLGPQDNGPRWTGRLRTARRLGFPHGRRRENPSLSERSLHGSTESPIRMGLYALSEAILRVPCAVAQPAGHSPRPSKRRF
jgi:hypothetical protein